MTITCQVCETEVHIIQTHLTKEHPELTIEQYQELYPMAPTMSDHALRLLEERRSQAGKGAKTVAAATASEGSEAQEYGLLHEVFGFGNVPAAMNASGEPIKIRVFNDHPNAELVPDKDPGYIFDINLVKSIIMALELNMPILLWGHMGAGKTTAYEQVCAYTGRPFLRVQHTANTEEADIEGTWRVADGDTIFQDGPLAYAMEKGFVFCADEYDFVSPMVASLYQAVLEGKPLRIKSANKIIRPHPDFRIVATGNTNGSGDESGLYSGTQIQNAANYERFAIVHKVDYMPAQQEIGILMGKTGIPKKTAEQLVEFANRMRGSFERRDVALPISPRSLLNATRLGLARDNWEFGMRSAYINRLPPTSAKVALETFQRVMG